MSVVNENRSLFSVLLLVGGIAARQICKEVLGTEATPIWLCVVLVALYVINQQKKMTQAQMKVADQVHRDTLAKLERIKFKSKNRPPVGLRGGGLLSDDLVSNELDTNRGSVFIDAEFKRDPNHGWRQQQQERNLGGEDLVATKARPKDVTSFVRSRPKKKNDDDGPSSSSGLEADAPSNGLRQRRVYRGRRKKGSQTLLDSRRAASGGVEVDGSTTTGTSTDT